MFLTTFFPGVSISVFAVIVFGLGIIIGSFLNVYIYRFHTGKSLSGHSHCLSCATPLCWFELFPLVSYLYLRGRCRTCGCRIPGRYFLVELSTGLLFVGGLMLADGLFELITLCIIFSLLVIITVYDLYHFIIPDSLTLALTSVVAAQYGYDFLNGHKDVETILWSFGTAVGGSAFFLFLWIISKGKWLGFGDVKLAFPLGFIVGPAFVFSFVVLSFWVGAVVSLLLLLGIRLSRGKASLHLPGPALTMKSAVPFAPFLVASCLIILFTNFNVLQLFSFA